MEILIKALQFFLSLTMLVMIHELGHFLTARMFRIRVEKFYIFFDPWFSLFHFKRGDTEYGMGWLPLGGYVKIAGMIDESMDKEQLKQEPKPWEFRTKPAWQRFCVMVAGVVMNFLMAFVIYCGISYTWGTSYIDNEDIRWGYNFNDGAKELGFQDGDRIVTINGEKVENYATIASRILLADSDTQIEVTNGGIPRTVAISYDALNEVRSHEENFAAFATPRMPFIIDSLASPTALASGLQRGDRIMGIVGERPEDDFLKYDSLLMRHAGKTIALWVERPGEMDMQIEVPVNAEGKIGVIVAMPFQPRTKRYSLLESIPAGARMTGNVIRNYWNQLKLLVMPDTGLYKQVGGFIAIANIFPDSWDWLNFWNMTAFLSIALGVMNIIPIPGLDGGHTLFTLWEMITRRRPSDKFLEIMQYIGLAIILAIFILANGNDVLRFIIK